jgi:hypothetical protein
MPVCGAGHGSGTGKIAARPDAWLASGPARILTLALPAEMVHSRGTSAGGVHNAVCAAASPRGKSRRIEVKRLGAIGLTFMVHSPSS